MKLWEPLIAPILVAGVVIGMSSLQETNKYNKDKEDLKLSEDLISKIKTLTSSIESLKDEYKPVNRKPSTDSESEISKAHSNQTPKLPSTNKAPTIESWQTVYDISWAKEGRELDVKKHSSGSNLDIFVEVKKLSDMEAVISILEYKNNEKMPVSDSENITIAKKEKHFFTYNEEEYRLNLVSIRAAGFFNSLAAFVSIDKQVTTKMVGVNASKLSPKSFISEE